MYSLPVHAIYLAKECLHSPRFKDVYIVRNQLQSLVPAEIRVKTNILNYVVIYDLLFHINTQEKKEIVHSVSHW